MTAARVAAPPGRAGRLWLEQRLRVGRRAADLLDRKLHILATELDRLQAQSEHTRQEWEQACRDAQRWLLRAVMLGGERAVELATCAGEARVTISYTATIGVRHPDGARCIAAEPDGWDGAVMAQARQAHRAALAAAVAHAAAEAALAAVQAEADITRYRLRAVRDRWIPRLQETLAQVEFSLEELERADAARLRRAGGASTVAAPKVSRQ